jgi:succinoglycan biosynthesis transport protein ExoP
MSKNFELLRRAGWADEYLEGIPSLPTSPSTTRDTRPRPRSIPHGTDQISALVQRIFHTRSDHPVHCVFFSGCTRKLGCSSVCVRAAQTLAAQVGGRVCVIDANLDSPSVHRYFGQENVVGLTDAVARSKPAENFMKHVPGNNFNNLWFLPSGPPDGNRRSIFLNPRLSSCLRELQRGFEYILIDAPALTSNHEPTILGQVADGAVLVVPSSGVAPEFALKARARLRSANVRLLGVVLSQCKPSLLGQLRN